MLEGEQGPTEQEPPMTTQDSRTQPAAGRLRSGDCHLDDLVEVLKNETDLEDYPHATRVEQQVLVYDAPLLRRTLADGDSEAVETEIAHALSAGPGIVVFERAFDLPAVDRVTAAFAGIIADQQASGAAAGDHFAKPGANDRVWNALEKLAVADPEAFVDYYGNDIVALASTAWLGPGYQVTSQVNVVNPGGAGQTVHRDYHLGFQSPERSAAYPAHVHDLSPMLTLQGAVAHSDMPVESGPTLYLPHSHKYRHGYLAYWLPEFQDYFVSHHVQLPLTKGDAVFFNPALLHAAGSNRTADVRRMANLLQVSSAFGRAMETVDRERVVNAIYPTLLARQADGAPARALDNAVAASAEGYAFPTNLDRDQPIGGMAPPSQADVVRRALAERTTPRELATLLAAQTETKRSH
jgi:ectoine hydroxylase-related dioxygenase (phytanoyl-CoA dioxygenase family)